MMKVIIDEQKQAKICRECREQQVKAARKAYLKDRLAVVVRNIPEWLEERVRQEKAEIKAIKKAKGAEQKALIAKLEKRLGISGVAEHQTLLKEIARLKCEHQMLLEEIREKK